MLNLFNKKTQNSKKAFSPHDFIYKPIDSNPKVLGLEHNPNIMRITQSDISPTEWCRMEYMRMGAVANSKKWKGL
jgi:hypothetical protein